MIMVMLGVWFLTSILLLVRVDGGNHGMVLAGRQLVAVSSVQFHALQLIVRAERGTADVDLQSLRSKLAAAIDRVENLHDQVLQQFGTQPGWLTAEASQAALMYSTGCMRITSRSGPCLSDRHPFAAVLSGGIHRAVSRFVEQGRSLLSYSTADLRRGPLASDEFLFLWTAAQLDLRDGLEQSRDLFYAHVASSLNVRRALDIVFFFALLGVLVALQGTLFSIRSLTTETERAARMMAMLPAEVDIRKLVINFRKETGATGSKLRRHIDS